MLLVSKENHFAKPASFTPSIHGEMFVPIGLNYSFWPYFHIGDLKSVLEGITFYQYDAVFPCLLGLMGRERQTHKDECNKQPWKYKTQLRVRRCFPIKEGKEHKQSD